LLPVCSVRRERDWQDVRVVQTPRGEMLELVLLERGRVVLSFAVGDWGE
jgi:hypothetical protein